MVYPTVDLSYLRAITDCTGVIQHGTHGVPNRRLGYTTDDNARALIVAIQHYETTGDRSDLDLAVNYLSYMHYAQSPDFKIRNIMTFQRAFLDDDGTEDCYGRTMWAWGYSSSSKLPENVRVVARRLFEDSIVWAADLRSPRSIAYTLLGMCYYLRDNEDTFDFRTKIDALAESLLHNYHTYRDKDWDWYEPYLTYGNAILPLGIMAAADVTGRNDLKDTAIDTIRFLTDNLIIKGRLEIIGNDGWYMKDGERAWFDQQTIDAGYTVYMYAKAFELFGDKEYVDLAQVSNSWFFGNNRIETWVYDPVSKGCFDAITSKGVNLNQGSESTICYLLAQLAMQRIGMSSNSIVADLSLGKETLYDGQGGYEKPGGHHPPGGDDS